MPLTRLRRRYIYPLLLPFLCFSGTTYDICLDTDATATSQWSALYSPNYPDEYGNDRDCSFGIHASEGHTIVLELMNFHTEENYDFVHIHDGQNDTAPLIVDRLSNLIQREIFDSSGQYIHIRFTSDGSQSYPGFHFRFKSTGECGFGF